MPGVDPHNLGLSFVLMSRTTVALGNWGEGILLLKRAMQAVPTLALAYQELSELYVSRRLFPAAEFSLRLGLAQGALSPAQRHTLFLRLARVGWLSGNADAGLEATGEAIKLFPNCAAARWLQGALHLKLNNHQKALRSFANAKEKEVSLFVNLGLARGYAQKGDKEQARQFLQQEETLQPGAGAVAKARKICLDES